MVIIHPPVKSTGKMQKQPRQCTEEADVLENRNTEIFVEAELQLVPILSWAATSFSDCRRERGSRNQNLRVRAHAWQ